MNKYSSILFKYQCQKVCIYISENDFPREKRNKIFLLKALFSSKSSFEIFSSTSEIFLD